MDELKRLKDENALLKEALSIFTIAFKSSRAKPNVVWSLGYWDETPKELRIDNIPQFNAVVKYGPEELRKIELLMK